MTITKLRKVIEIMRQTYNFDDDDATISVDDMGMETTVKICAGNRESKTYIILEKHVKAGEEIE